MTVRDDMKKRTPEGALFSVQDSGSDDSEGDQDRQ